MKIDRVIDGRALVGKGLELKFEYCTCTRQRAMSEQTRIGECAQIDRYRSAGKRKRDRERTATANVSGSKCRAVF